MSSRKPLTVYCYPQSYYSQKALLGLSEKGIPFRIHSVNLAKYEQYTDWYMKINPRGQVPVMEVDGNFVPESSVIIKYADDHGTVGPKLMAEDSKALWSAYEKKFEEIKIEIVTYGVMTNPDLSPNLSAPMFLVKRFGDSIRQSKRTKLAQKMMTQNPDMTSTYQKKIPEIQQFEENCRNRQVVQREIEKVREILQEVNDRMAQLPEKEWLCGEDMTIADICLMILLNRLRVVGLSEDLWGGDKMSQIKAYLERVSQRKSFQEICVAPTSARGVALMWLSLNRLPVSVVSGTIVLGVALAVAYWWQKK